MIQNSGKTWMGWYVAVPSAISRKKKPRRQDQMGRAKGRRGLHLLAIFVVLVAFFLWVDPSDLPDYEAYERIYQDSLLDGEWEIAFVMVNFFFRQRGFSYSDFRDFILIFSSLALWLLLSRLQPAHRAKPISVSVANSLLMFFVLAVLMFEYFVIRIRAGFAMGIIFCAVFFLKSPRVLLGRILAALFLVLAFFTHKSTTAILTVFLGVLFMAEMWRGRPRSKDMLFILFSVGAVAYLLYTTHSSFELRGEHIFSPLNPVRFVMLSVVPLILFFFVKNESRITLKGRNAVADLSFYFVRFYVVLAMGLALMFFAGLTGESGEALVRLYTLSSVPALLSFRLSGSAMRAPISAYILAINGLFFLATIFLPGGAG